MISHLHPIAVLAVKLWLPDGHLVIRVQTLVAKGWRGTRLVILQPFNDGWATRPLNSTPDTELTQTPQKVADILSQKCLTADECIFLTPILRPGAPAVPDGFGDEPGIPEPRKL